MSNQNNSIKAAHIFFDLLVIVTILLPFQFEIAPEIFFFITLGTVFYTVVGNKTPRNNFFLEAIYALSLIGVMFIVLGMTILSISIIAAIPMVFIFLVFALLKTESAKNPYSFIYNHPSRYIIYPILYNLFLIVSKVYLLERIPGGLALITVLFMYIPFRILAFWSEKEGPLESLFKFISIIWATTSLFLTIAFSPNYAVWDIIGENYDGDEKVSVFDISKHSKYKYLEKLYHKDSTYSVIKSELGRVSLKYMNGTTIRMPEKDPDGNFQYKTLTDIKMLVLRRSAPSSFFTDNIGIDPLNKWEIDFNLSQAILHLSGSKRALIKNHYQEIDSYYHTVLSLFPVEIPVYANILSDENPQALICTVLSDIKSKDGVLFKSGSYPFIIKNHQKTIDWDVTDALSREYLNEDWYNYIKK
jgi:hypothetical protein